MEEIKQVTTRHLRTGAEVVWEYPAAMDGTPQRAADRVFLGRVMGQLISANQLRQLSGDLLSNSSQALNLSWRQGAVDSPNANLLNWPNGWQLQCQLQMLAQSIDCVGRQYRFPCQKRDELRGRHFDPLRDPFGRRR